MTGEERRFDVAVIGGGSGAEALVRELDGSGRSTVVFEPNLVGGECPFVACMPSKAMLHAARAATGWDDAVAHRDRIVEHLDDSGHADDLAALGVELVRERAELVDAGTVRAGGREYVAEHVVIATGAAAVDPGIDGLDLAAGRVWTSEDAMRATTRPERLVVIGGGVIGIECAALFAGFGTAVRVAEPVEPLLPHAPRRVGELVAASLERLGVDLHVGRAVTAVEERPDDVVVVLDDGDELVGDRVLVAVGRTPRTRGIGLERLGIDPSRPLPLEPSGRVRGTDGSVWAIGDVAGVGQYTHLANHHGAVVADHLVGTATRRFDDVAVPRCVFTSPPVAEVGPTWQDLDGDPDVVSVGYDLATFPRALTDELVDGHLWVAARRSTGCIVAAAGVGPSFDELVHAIVVAIDGRVPVARLRRSMQPFPTVGEILGPIWSDLHDALTG